ncbi:mechanosensitive ion channel [Candidatus Gracilibacteria bacterium]|nr:mechanosensitive ion channel [Candidatus Gracilibacteria bacterium]
MLWNTAFAQTANKVVEETYSFVDFFASLGKWGSALLVILIFFILAKVLKKIIAHRIIKQSKYEVHQEIVILTERVVYFFVILLGVSIAFTIIDINIGWVVGPMSVGLGFAFKDLLSNFIAGVVILTQKKFKIGDVIKVDGRLGKITEINVRITQIQAFDGTSLIVPNADLLTNVIQNFTSNTFRRISLQVGVHYSTPLADAIKLTLNSVKKNKEVFSEPAPQVLAMEFGDSAILLEARFWIESSESWYNVRSEIIQQLKIDFDAAGINIPFPIRTLTLDEYDKNLLKACNLPVEKKVVDTSLNS